MAGALGWTRLAAQDPHGAEMDGATREGRREQTDVKEIPSGQMGSTGCGQELLKISL